MGFANSVSPRRRAFTLTELLVVIAIIAILTALTAAGYFYWIGSQQRRNSEQTLREVNKVLGQHWSYVYEEAKKETPSDAIKQLAGGDNARAQVLWIKARLIEAFPMTYNEVNNCPMYANIPVASIVPPAPAIPLNRRNYNASYVRALGGRTNAIDPTTEMGACL